MFKQMCCVGRAFRKVLLVLLNRYQLKLGTKTVHNAKLKVLVVILKKYIFSLSYLCPVGSHCPAAQGAGCGRQPVVHPPGLRGVRVPDPPQDRVPPPAEREREGVR